MENQGEFEIRRVHDPRVSREIAMIGRPSGFVEPNGYVKDQAFPVYRIAFLGSNKYTREALIEQGQVNEQAITLAESYSESHAASLRKDAELLEKLNQPTEWDRAIARAAGAPEPTGKFSVGETIIYLIIAYVVFSIGNAWSW